MDIFFNGKPAPAGVTLDDVEYVFQPNPDEHELTLKLRALHMTVPEAAAPPADNGTLLFSDDFSKVVDLEGFNTKQITNGGNLVLLRGLALEARAPVGAKAELGHDWPIANGFVHGDVWTFEGEFELLAGGPSEIFILDVETTGTSSQDGPRLRRKDGKWGIEQDKFGGVNIQPGATTPPMQTGRRYSFKWQSKFHPSAGWHKLWVDGVEVFNTDVDGKRGATGPGPNLNRFRWGATINSSNAPATIRWYKAAAWIKRA